MDVPETRPGRRTGVKVHRVVGQILPKEVWPGFELLNGRELMKVEEILKSKGRSVQIIEADASIGEAIGQLNGSPQIGALVVVDGLGQRPFVGTLAECDIIRTLGRYGATLLTMRVADVMSRNVPTCAPQDNIARLMRQMTASRYRHLPVVDRGKLAGVVSIGDVVKARIADMELETSLLRDLYIARA
jgi:CBS domain-containing protein